MAWSGDFKRLRCNELKHMKIKDRMNPTMTAEYYGIINGIIDPKTTHYFAEKATTHNARRWSKDHHFMQTEMVDLQNKNHYSYIKNNKLSDTILIKKDKQIFQDSRGSISSSTDSIISNDSFVLKEINNNNNNGTNQFVHRFIKRFSAQF